jgi:hygromycin-B 7''-O-kinase
MLPPVRSLDEFRTLRRDTEAQRAAMVAIAERHGLSASELRPCDLGTHLVWCTDRSVVKVFVPLWPEDAEVEISLLRHLTGAGAQILVPQLEHVGKLNGWLYVVMSRLEGEPIGEVWPRSSPSDRVSLALQMGETMARLNELSTSGLEHLHIEQDALVAERVPKLREDQRDRGGDGELEAALGRFVTALPELVPAEPVLLHADLTGDHFLVRGGRIVALIDFADAFVGPWTYELAAPACFMTRGDEAAERAMLEGRGVEATPELLRSLRVWCVLHRYADVAIMMRDAKAATLEQWLDAFWAWDPLTPP